MTVSCSTPGVVLSRPDIVVVNHYLLMADLVLKEKGFGDLLPGADAIVIDEAHQLPDIARIPLLQRQHTSVERARARRGGRELLLSQQLATNVGSALGGPEQQVATVASTLAGREVAPGSFALA
jgi:Rad3-related DNA helicase